MSLPCTIMEAISILERRKSKLTAAQSQTNSPVDIVAVVVNHSVLLSPASFRPFFPRVEIWISDESMSPGLQARVTLHGTAEASRVSEEQVSVGDVIRFNRISLGKNSTKESVQFVHSSSDPEPGVTWFRLSRANGNNSDAARIINQGVSTARRTPDNMITSQSKVAELSSWFRRTRSHGGLAPLPCKRRRLSEIQSSVGLLSNVAVRIEQFDCQVTPRTEVITGKRKRTSPIEQKTIGFATVTDSSGVSMSLVDPENRFEKSLRAAEKSGEFILLTNISTKNETDVKGKTVPNQEVVLVPTRATTVNTLSKDYQVRNDADWPSLDETSQTQVSNREGLIAVISSIEDISIGDISLRNSKCLESPSGFLETMITHDGDYQSALLHLESRSTLLDQLGKTFYAGPLVVKSLCGGVDADELANDEALVRHCSQLLHALLNEKVLFRVIIDPKRERPQAVKIVLHGV